MALASTTLFMELLWTAISQCQDILVSTIFAQGTPLLYGASSNNMHTIIHIMHSHNMYNSYCCIPRGGKLVSTSLTDVNSKMVNMAAQAFTTGAEVHSSG